MRPQKQRYMRNNSSANEFGDCHRTCIAMILNMHRDHVPHFMDGVPPSAPSDHQLCVLAEKREIEWLARRGLTAVNIPFPGETQLSEVIEMMSKLAHGAPMILGCTSNSGCNHSVVIHDGEVHNPNNGEIVEPMRDGYWWLTIYSVGPNWRSRRLGDRIMEFLRT